MTQLRTRDVATLLGMTPGQVRWFARSGVLTPERDPRNGQYCFTFRDLVLLRTAAGLLAAHIPPHRVVRALHRLRTQLPEGRALTEIRIHAEGDDVVACDGGASWSAESGQILLDFAVADLVTEVASLADHRDVEPTPEGPATVAEWFRLGVELEAKAPAEAREAYRRALALDASHADANINLGRLLHEAGRAAEAALHYRRALAGGADATASYNLGVALEDLNRPAEARTAYAAAIETNPELADAHYNLANLCERLGDGRAALRHLRRYRELAEHGAGTVH